MREQTTTWQRSIAAARKLQPAVRQVGNAMLFDVASTSHLDQYYHVELSYNKSNPLKETKCECGGPKWVPCVHRLAALLQYVSNLEAMLWKGANYVCDLEDDDKTPTELYEKHLNIWLDMLNRYERASDIIKAIDAGQDINSYTGKQKTGDPSPDKKQLLISA